MLTLRAAHHTSGPSRHGSRGAKAASPQLTAAAAARAGQVEWEYALWTDPDVLFYADIDACTLPKPPLLSTGPESVPDSKGNCGVVYYCLPAYKEEYPAVLKHAAARRWQFMSADQVRRACSAASATAAASVRASAQT